MIMKEARYSESSSQVTRNTVCFRTDNDLIHKNEFTYKSRLAYSELMTPRQLVMVSVNNMKITGK